MKLRESSRFGLTLVLLAVLFVALVMLSELLLRGARLDLTENEIYTLSRGTQEVLSEIDEPINLTFYFSDSASESLPMLREYAQRVREMLEEFEMHAGGAIRLREVDPEPFTEAEEMAREHGLQGIPLDNSGERLYFGLVGTNGVDDKVLIPYFQPGKEVFLEYDIAQLVQTLAQPKLARVGLHTALPMTGQGDPSNASAAPWMIYEQLEGMFDLTRLDAEDLSLADTYDELELLVLAHPRPLSQAARYRIEQFLIRGGRVLLFADPLAEGDASTAATGVGVASPVDEMLADWGIVFDPDAVVLDRQLYMEVGQPDGTTGPDPAILRLRQDQISQSDIITAQLDQVVLSTAGSLRVADGGALGMVALLRSSVDSRTMEAQQVAVSKNPAQWLEDFDADGQRHVLAARFSGLLEATLTPEEVDASIEAAQHRMRASEPVNLIVVADSDLLRDRFWVDTRQFLGQRVAQAWSNNGDFVANAIDNLTGSSALISIRTRASTQRPFERVEALRREAGQRLIEAEAQLERELAETEQRLTQLQRQQGDGNGLTMTDAQSAEIQRFQQRQRELNRQLRDVRRELDTEIEALGTRLKLLNILAIPLLLSLVGMLVFWRRYRRGGGR